MARALASLGARSGFARRSRTPGSPGSMSMSLTATRSTRSTRPSEADVEAGEPLARSALEQAALVRAGEIGARELVEAALAAIERQNPRLNAFVALCPERALAEADAVRPSDPRPLCGVPVGVKDLLNATRDLPLSEGSGAFGDWSADHDSAHVRRLREAGAIIVGRTNTPELGLRPVTENVRFGATRNPWNPGLSAGGPSGGSAPPGPAGMGGLAGGRDLGGSSPPPANFAAAVARPPARVAVRLARDAPLGVPVDAQPRIAAERAAEALAELGHELDEGAPDWDDEDFPPAWSTFATGALQHLVRVVERLHGRPLDPQRLEPATRAWILDSEPVTLIDYLEARERLIAFARRVMRSWPADGVLVTPTLTRLPAPIGGIQPRGGVTDDAVRFSALVRIWNVTGQPAISLPLHESADGIPVGVQLIAPPGRDDLLLGLAAQLEQSVGWRPQL